MSVWVGGSAKLNLSVYNSKQPYILTIMFPFPSYMHAYICILIICTPLVHSPHNTKKEEDLHIRKKFSLLIMYIHTTQDS